MTQWNQVFKTWVSANPSAGRAIVSTGSDGAFSAQNADWTFDSGRWNVLFLAKSWDIPGLDALRP